MMDGDGGPPLGELGITSGDLNLRSRRDLLVHDGAVHTDEAWLQSFTGGVATLYGQYQDPKDVCRRYNELYPEYDGQISSKSLNLDLAGKIRRGHCVTAILSLGAWAESKGLQTYYFPRNYNHQILCISPQDISLPRDMDSATFLELKRSNPQMRLFEYVHAMPEHHIYGLHEVNERMLETMYRERKLKEQPQRSVKGALQTIDWWQGTT